MKWLGIILIFSALILGGVASADWDGTVQRIIGPAVNPVPPVKAPVGLVAGIITRDGFPKNLRLGEHPC